MKTGMMTKTTMMRMTDPQAQPALPPGLPGPLPVQLVQHPAQVAPLLVQLALPLVQPALLQMRLPKKNLKKKRLKPTWTKMERNGGKMKTAPGGTVSPAKKNGKSTMNEGVMH
jgi:hypothetical protein